MAAGEGRGRPGPVLLHPRQHETGARQQPIIKLLLSQGFEHQVAQLIAVGIGKCLCMGLISDTDLQVAGVFHDQDEDAVCFRRACFAPKPVLVERLLVFRREAWLKAFRDRGGEGLDRQVFVELLANFASRWRPPDRSSPV